MPVAHRLRQWATAHCAVAIAAAAHVAAYFTSLQRRAVKAGVEAAGVHVVQMLSEPVAAAMAYGLFVAGKKQVGCGSTYDGTAGERSITCA